jgi:hypothetical protein
MTERKSLESPSSQRKSAENSEKLLQLLFSAISAAFSRRSQRFKAFRVQQLRAARGTEDLPVVHSLPIVVDDPLDPILQLHHMKIDQESNLEVQQTQM